MIKKLINTIAVSLAMFGAVLVPLAPATVYAAGKEDICKGVALTGAECTDKVAAEESVTGTVANIINLLSIAVGVVSVIMIIIGGFKYVTSGGESSSTQSAKNTILYAIIGLVVVLLAQTIVIFVLNKFK